MFFAVVQSQAQRDGAPQDGCFGKDTAGLEEGHVADLGRHFSDEGTCSVEFDKTSGQGHLGVQVHEAQLPAQASGTLDAVGIDSHHIFSTCLFHQSVEGLGIAPCRTDDAQTCIMESGHHLHRSIIRSVIGEQHLLLSRELREDALQTVGYGLRLVTNRNDDGEIHCESRHLWGVKT